MVLPTVDVGSALPADCPSVRRRRLLHLHRLSPLRRRLFGRGLVRGSGVSRSRGPVPCTSARWGPQRFPAETRAVFRRACRCRLLACIRVAFRGGRARGAVGDGGRTPSDAKADGGSVARSIVRRDGTESGAPPGIEIASGRAGQLEACIDSVIITGQTWRPWQGVWTS